LINGDDGLSNTDDKLDFAHFSIAGTLQLVEIGVIPFLN